MGDRRISVAITPNGLVIVPFPELTCDGNDILRRADAVTRGPDNKLYFVEPHAEQMTMGELLARLIDQGKQTFISRGIRTHEDNAGVDPSSNVYYLQSQNGNLYSSEHFNSGDSSSEYDPLREDVPSEVSWCSEALGLLTAPRGEGAQ